MKITFIEGGPGHPDAAALLQSIGQVVFNSPGEDPETVARQSGAQALLVGAWTINGAVLDRLPAVQMVGRPGIGYDKVHIPDCTARGIVVFNTPDGPTESTAELTVTFVLALARRLRVADQRVREGRFGMHPSVLSMEVAGKTLGLIGLGRIGGRVAEICGRGLGMRVLAYDPFAPAGRAAEVGAEWAQTPEEVFGRSDFVSLHAPPGPATIKIVRRETLALMKPTAYLINCGRGVLVDEAALLEALTAGRLAGAGLDVYNPEPPAPDNPLFKLDNVLFTPHIASFTPDGLRKMYVMAAQQTVEVFAGRRPAYILNPEVWDSPTRRR